MFLLKRPKGTKSRRWARGLPYAPREYPLRTYRGVCPASHERTTILGAGRDYALCSGSPFERHFERTYIGFLWAISCQLETKSKRQIVIRPDDVNPRYPRHRVGNHKGCPYKCEKMAHLAVCAAGGGGGGSFRAYPSSTGAPCVRMGTQGTDAFIRRLGDSRKNRPRAERRRSFWSFFLGVQEKGRREKKKN